MTDSQQPQIISYGLPGHRPRYGLETPPPAARVSRDPCIAGEQYGRVKIISAEKRWKTGWKDPYVLTRCVSCGRIQWQHLYNLKRGLSKGCQACSQPRRVPKWLERRCSAAKQRCENPNVRNYRNYGGRGIRFCFGSPTNAALWIAQNLGLPSREMELDRIDTNGNYEPGNIRWATHQQNCQNQRRYMTSSTVDPTTDSP